MTAIAADARREPDIERALIDTGRAIAGIAQRGQLTGPEATYARRISAIPV
jgi:hypothetical protein